MKVDGLISGKEIKGKISLKGSFLMVFSSLCFAFMTYYAKLATYQVPGIEVTFFRLATGTIVVLGMAAFGRVKIVTENYKLLLVRGLFGGIAVMLFFYALEKGTITNSVVLQNTYPIFAALLSIYILKEKMSIRLCGLMALTFVGIIILIRPEITHVKIADLMALVSGFLGGFAVTAIRQLRQKNESVWTIFFYFCFFGAIVSFFLGIPSWKWPRGDTYLWISLTALLGLVGQVVMTAAYKYCNTAVGGILSMSTSVFSFILGIIFFHEKTGLLDFSGVFLIIFSNILVIASEKNADNGESS